MEKKIVSDSILEIMKIKRHPVFKDYAASESGDIFTLKHGNIKQMKPQPHGRGYYQLFPSVAGYSKPYLAHRFVWECWNGIIEKDLQINHIDHCKTNNQLENLELVTNTENRLKAMEAGIKFGRPFLS